MAETTITINASTNPTYGGHVDFDGTSTYVRTVLSGGNPTVSFATPNIKRIFAFFDLSTDPTSGGTITKVELLGTVNSVDGTHEIGLFGGESGTNSPAGGPGPGVNPNHLSDDSLYTACSDSGDNFTFANNTPSAGAVAIDLGSDAIASVNAGIAADTGLFIGSRLSNEAAAGSVVFDAAAGFGLRITYTPAASGPGVHLRAGMTMLGLG